MAAARKLKVFRTAIGFHDAYVAAPSRKAALEAWGASKDLFAIGSAEQVTDAALMKEALAHPGQVIKRSRGDLSDQLAALPKTSSTKPSKAIRKPAARKSKPKPRPVRDKLDRAEAAVRAFEDQTDSEMSALRDREEELRRERQALERQHETTARKLESRLAKARVQYEQALSNWRDAV